MNEEYRSTLEALETSKEELQSINEELTTVNQELQDRLQDLSQSNTDLQNLMAATDVGMLFVDQQMTIQFFTPPLAQLFSLLPIDRGRPLAHVTHRLDAVDLLHEIRQVVETQVPREREVQRDDGRLYLMRLTPYHTPTDRADGVVVTFVDTTPLKQVEQQVRESAEQFRALIDASAQIVWTTDATAQEMGSGLGLLLCRNIVEGHGGTIRLVSQAGHGTTVSITLPVAAPDVQTPAGLPPPTAPGQPQRGAILVIDDEPGIAQALTALLRRSGNDITTVTNGAAGLAAIEERLYDVILCDMRMPDLDGPGFYRELERRHPHLLARVIFLTGDVLSPEAQEVIQEVLEGRGAAGA